MHYRFTTLYSRTLCISVAVIVLSTAIASFAASQLDLIGDSAAVSTSTREGRLAVFDDAWETIQERYYDPRFGGIDWQKERLIFRPLAAEASGSQEFYDVLRQMVLTLKDPHTRVFSPEEKFDWWNPRFVTVGLSIRDIEGLPTVVSVAPDSAASRAHIKAGDVITAVDNLPAERVIEHHLRGLGLPLNQVEKTHATVNLIEGAAQTFVTLSWRDRHNHLQTARLLRSWTEKRLGFQISRRDGIVVVKIDVFTPTIARELLRSLPGAIQNAKGVVLDVRANGGGDAEAMAEVISAFVAEGMDLGNFTDRAGVSFELQTSLKLISAIPTAAKTWVPIAVLTGDSTSSAAEIFAAALQKYRGARIIGSQTCGCVLAIRNRHELPDGGVLDVSELDYRTADGVRLEGSGVRPSEVVVVRRRDIYKGRDEVMRAAETFINLGANSSRK